MEPGKSFTKPKEQKSESASFLMHVTLLGSLLIFSSQYSPNTGKQSRANLKPYVSSEGNHLHPDTLAKRNNKKEIRLLGDFF